MPTQPLLLQLKNLQRLHQQGQLGGAEMPEDARPDQLLPGSADQLHFFTLPMALNYQRNSYALWQAARATYLDPQLRPVFSPVDVVKMTEDELREALLTHKLALQPNRHVQIWQKICTGLVELFQGDVRQLLAQCGYDVVQLKQQVQQQHKARFPYLSGEKIFNYWLYVLSQYTPTELKNRQAITVAPDTHIIQATVRLGLLPGPVEHWQTRRAEVAAAWDAALQGSGQAAIDFHTPLWLWSRAGFPTLPQS